jgi:uncharacterized protein (TIGR02444 family)
VRWREYYALNCDNPFWKFSLAVYAAPSVAAECLVLQRALDIDVNILLFCAWLGSAKKILNEEDFAMIDARVRSWQATVVQPLRTVRQEIKAMAAIENEAVQQMRKQIADVELRAEQVEQAMLFEAAREVSDKVLAPTAEEAIRHNLTVLLQRKSAGSSRFGSTSTVFLLAAALGYRPETA